MVKRQDGRVKKGSPPVALTIAGSDSSSGAGIQADLKAFSAFGVYGVTAVTGIVAETPGLVAKLELASSKILSAQIDVLLKNFPIAAIKTGLLFSGEIVSKTADLLRKRAAQANTAIPLVVDPVMIATSGDTLLRANAVQAYERELFPLAALITPNLDEATWLFGERINSLGSMRKAGPKLMKKYGIPILLKGGHLGGEKAIDLLILRDRTIEFSAPFSRGITTHGTGCTYSAAITAGVAKGLSLDKAVRFAKKFVSAAIKQYLGWKTTSGRPLQALNHSPNDWK